MQNTYTITQGDYIILYYKTDKYGDPLLDMSDLTRIFNLIKITNPDKKIYTLPDTVNIELANKETLYEAIVKILKQLKPNILITEVDDGK